MKWTISYKNKRLLIPNNNTPQKIPLNCKLNVIDNVSFWLKNCITHDAQGNLCTILSHRLTCYLADYNAINTHINKTIFLDKISTNKSQIFIISNRLVLCNINCQKTKRTPNIKRPKHKIKKNESKQYFQYCNSSFKSIEKVLTMLDEEFPSTVTCQCHHKDNRNNEF